MSRASRWNRLHPLSLWAISGLISFRALFLSSWRLSTSQTSPMPPSPTFSRSRYLPKRSRPFAIMGGGAMFHPSDFSLAGCGEPSSDSPLSWLSPDEVGVKDGGVKPRVLCSLSWLSPGEVGVKDGGVKPRVLCSLSWLSPGEVGVKDGGVKPRVLCSLSWLSPGEVGVKDGGVKPRVLCSLSWLSPGEVGVKDGGVKPRVLSLIFELSRDEDPRSGPSQVSRSRSPRRSCGCGCMCGRPKLGDTDRAGNR